MKQRNYIIKLKAPDLKLVDRISKWMLFLSFILFIYNAVSFEKSRGIFYNIISVVLLVWFIWFSYLKKNKAVRYYRIGLFIAAIGWLYMLNNYSLIAVILIVAALFEKQVKLSPELKVDETGISFNSFPAKAYKWNDLNNLVVRDGLLTVDYKTNKIFQKEIDVESNVVEEMEFNTFCQEQLMTEARNAPL